MKKTSLISSRTGRKKKAPRGKPFQPGNEYSFKPGQSGNPGGRPKMLSVAAKVWLEQINEEDVEFESVHHYKRTNAEILVAAMGIEVLNGEVGAFNALLKASEGDKLKIESDDSMLLVKVDK